MAEAKLDITDELLVAFVDGELDATQRSMVSAALSRDPALGRRAEEMRLARQLLCEAFPLQTDAVVPAGIAAAAKRLAAACARHASPARPAMRFRYAWTYAMVAAFAWLGAGAATYFALRAVGQPSATSVTQIDPTNPLHRVLESTPSAQVIEVPGEDTAVRAILTFRAKDGRFCREFEVLAESGGSTGIACREDGVWRTEVLLGAAIAPPDSNFYTPAAADDEQAVAAVAERLMQGEPLSAAQEARVLANGWRSDATEHS